MIRLGLCCLFVEQPIKFSTTTATHLLKLSEKERLQKLSRLCLANAEALKQAYEFCAQTGIGCFRINSQILPLKTHPQLAYQVTDLPDGKSIIATFRQCGELLRQHALRASFHPDQFVVLNSPNPRTVSSSLAEIEYQNEVAEWVGADVINIHAGGGYGDKPAALKRFAEAFTRLSPSARQRVTLENDDKTYTPSELLPLCHELAIPLVYDVHHHRCLPDDLSVEEATAAALQTWRREPMFHLSSPLEGWQGKQPHRHHDYIDTADFPDNWLQLDCDFTIEVEAKAKELAVLKLKQFLSNGKKSSKSAQPQIRRIGKRKAAGL
ncbi:MAG: UV DNA damage repair endonuclease UvsE [Candidatus Riflebacteria bacterium]|nr:UV DNA damage repair endonuclease UvsE [Candidatus Riflebacteria bacterium]